MEFTFVISSSVYFLLIYFMVLLLMEGKASNLAVTPSTLVTPSSRSKDVFQIKINKPKYNGSPYTSFDIFRVSVMNYYKLTAIEDTLRVPMLLTMLEGAAQHYYIGKKLFLCSTIEEAFSKMEEPFSYKSHGYHMERLFSMSQRDNENIYQFFMRCITSFEGTLEKHQIYYFIRGLQSTEIKDAAYTINFNSLYEALNFCMQREIKTNPGSWRKTSKGKKKCHLCHLSGHLARSHFDMTL